MQFSMNAQDLLEGLNTVTRALSARPAKQILEGVLIEAEDDRVTLTCSDGSLNIESINAADVRENGRVVLPGRLFNELIRKLPGGVVTITVNDDRTANSVAEAGAKAADDRQHRVGKHVFIDNFALRKSLSTGGGNEIGTHCLKDGGACTARLLCDSRKRACYDGHYPVLPCADTVCR